MFFFLETIEVVGEREIEVDIAYKCEERAFAAPNFPRPVIPARGSVV